MNRLDGWLKQATRQLSKDSAAQVRTEIQQHYDAEREAVMRRGANADEADRLATAALGDPRVANRQYRKVLLTSAEARMLRDGAREARAVCSRPGLRRLVLAMPLAMLLVAAWLFFAGAIEVARVLLLGGVGVGVLLAVPFLPIYTPSRGRVFRLVKWVLLAAIFVLVFGLGALKWSWLFFSCLWPVGWIEWTRVSIRRKLPVAQWPKHLYL